MLKVNLLPESARKVTLSPVEQLHRTPLMWLVVGLMSGFALLQLVPLTLRYRQLQQLIAKIQVLQPKKLEVNQMQRLVQQLRAQETAFRGLKSRQGGLWSKRLNILSNVTPDGVWYTELMLEPAKGLIVQGSAIGQGGPEMVSVGRLVQDLKTHPGFASAINDIQIESIKRVQDRDIEVVQFTLSCAIAEAPTTKP